MEAEQTLCGKENFAVLFAKKKEDPFFVMLRAYAAKLTEMAEVFDGFLARYPAVDGVAEELKAFESDCDGRKHAIVHELYNSFVTPFDREDIFTLADQLDDLADFMEEIACRFYIYNVTVLRPEAAEMGALLTRMVRAVERMMSNLGDKKADGPARAAIVEINDIENEGDALYRRALAALFREETGPIDVIRWKNLYETMENALDAGEHLADTVEGIFAKNA